MDNHRTPQKCYEFYDQNNERSSSKKKLLFSGAKSNVFINSSIGYSNSEKSNGVYPTTMLFGVDLIQSKIEYLEKDRIDLSLQLHKRDERDRDRKLRLDLIENKLRVSENEVKRGNEMLKKLEEKNFLLQYEKNELEKEIKLIRDEVIEVKKRESLDAWNKMSSASKEIRRIEEENLSIRQQMMETILDHEKKTGKLLEVSSHNNELERQLFASKQMSDNLTTELKVVRSELHQVQSAKDELEKDKEELEMKMMIITNELEDTRSKLSEQIETVAELQRCDPQKHKKDAQFGIGLDSESDLNSIIQKLRDDLKEKEHQRRLLHNQIQDLKGKVRVFIRCRPFLPSEIEDSPMDGDEIPSPIQCHLDDISLSLTIPAPSSSHASNTMRNINNQQKFVFNRVFASSSNQEDIYHEVSPLIQSVFDGYRVCIFSYGQTGSGKTHTMTGRLNGDHRGITPRSVSEMLGKVIDMKSSGDWEEVSLIVSIIELYNEEIKDLLVLTNESHSMDNKNKFKITRNADGRTMIHGLTSIPIKMNGSGELDNGIQQFQSLLEVATRSRSTAATAMNETSSRSHQIVMIDLIAHHRDKITRMQGGLRLCDLAGSERLDRSETANDAVRLKETVSINKSLSCLADVFLALSSKAPHIPYRNSKLTMLLQDCLSGSGKSVMFVNISPTMASGNESLCSLRFANQVSQVELGKAQKNIFTINPSQPVVLPSSNPSKVVVDGGEENGSQFVDYAGEIIKPVRNRRVSMVSTSLRARPTATSKRSVEMTMEGSDVNRVSTMQPFQQEAIIPLSSTLNYDRIDEDEEPIHDVVLKSRSVSRQKVSHFRSSMLLPVPSTQSIQQRPMDDVPPSEPSTILPTYIPFLNKKEILSKQQLKQIEQEKLYEQLLEFQRQRQVVMTSKPVALPLEPVETKESLPAEMVEDKGNRSINRNVHFKVNDCIENSKASDVTDNLNQSMNVMNTTTTSNNIFMQRIETSGQLRNLGSSLRELRPQDGKKNRSKDVNIRSNTLPSNAPTATSANFMKPTTRSSQRINQKEDQLKQQIQLQHMAETFALAQKTKRLASTLDINKENDHRAINVI